MNIQKTPNFSSLTSPHTVASHNMVLKWTTSYVPIKSVSFPSSRKETYILFVKYFLSKMADVWKVRVRVTATYRVHRSLRYCVTLMSTCYLFCSFYRWFILLCTNSLKTVTLFTPRYILFFKTCGLYLTRPNMHGCICQAHLSTFLLLLIKIHTFLMLNGSQIHWKHTFFPHAFCFSKHVVSIQPDQICIDAYVKHIMPSFLLLLIRKWCKWEVNINIKEKK